MKQKTQGMLQISNKIFCEDFLTKLNITTKILPNPYYDYPYLIIKDFISTKICEEITASVKKSNDIVEAKIRKYTGIRVKSDKDTKIRKTNIYKLSSIHQNIYNKNFLKHQQQIEDFFHLPLTTSTKVQVLEYTKGSFYKQHSDDSSILLQDDKVIGFKPVALQRKLTTILFTTSYSETITKDTFNGGKLLFNYLYDENAKMVQIAPKAGDMLVFLSNPYFSHEVTEVIAGHRVSLVQWHDAIFR